MHTIAKQTTILFVTTFPPRKCGIASFTQDLIQAFTPGLDEHVVIKVCALDKIAQASQYENPVSMLMDGHDLNSCMETAARINQDSSIQLVCIEHEFGLYGGELGDYLLGFLSLIEKPFLIRFHTVLPGLDAKRRKIVQTIGLLAEKVLVMTNHSARLLKDDYLIAPDKILLIPHGTHANSMIDRDVLKRKYRLENKLVLTTFGLLSPNKGIEKGILAMKTISKAFPQAMYIVLGHTHPNLLEQEGEKYRDGLQALIDENGLQDNVRLLNEYVPTQKLMEYLSLTDIYLFTSRDPNQAVSGTFLYAMGAGCAIISNAFVLAKEMLDEHTGMILKTDQAEELAEDAIYLLKEESVRVQMGRNAFLKTRDSTWKKVAGKHNRLFNEILGGPAEAPALSNEFISKTN